MPIIFNYFFSRIGISRIRLMTFLIPFLILVAGCILLHIFLIAVTNTFSFVLRGRTFCWCYYRDLPPCTLTQVFQHPRAVPRFHPVPPSSLLTFPPCPHLPREPGIFSLFFTVFAFSIFHDVILHDFLSVLHFVWAIPIALIPEGLICKYLRMYFSIYLWPITCILSPMG